MLSSNPSISKMVDWIDLQLSELANAVFCQSRISTETRVLDASKIHCDMPPSDMYIKPILREKHCSR